MAFAPKKGPPHQRHADYGPTNRSLAHHAQSTSPPPPPAGPSSFRFLHNGKVMEFEGSIFDKLVDPTLYTGTHKHRFDEYGRGRGLQGRREACELLDSGVMFDSHPGGGGGGDAASDRSETLWMKSLRAAVHSPSLAKKLASPTPTPASSSLSAARRRGMHISDDDGNAPPPLVQAWSLDAAGRLVFDEARTHRLAMQQQVNDDAVDVTRRATTDAIGYDVDRDRGRGGGGGQHGNEATHQYHHQKQQQRHDQHYPPASAARRAHQRPEDARKQHDIASHMRKLLYDDDGVDGGNAEYLPNDNVAGGGARGPPSLEETMAMLHAFESNQRRQ